MNRKIIRLAIPNIISNLTVPLLSSVDTAIVGHLDQISYLGAMAIGGMIFNFIYWGFGFLRMGTTGLTAQAFGENNHDECLRILIRALLVGGISSIFLLLFQKGIAAISFFLVDTTEQVEHFAKIYFYIRIISAPATLSIYALSGWFLGMQNAKYPMIIAIFTNCLNILFNLYFIKVMDMNVDGVAWGTVCANYLGLIFTIYLFLKSYGKLRENIDLKSIIHLSALKRFFAINRDIFIRTLVLIFAFSFFTAKSAEMGEVILSVNAILLNLWTIMSYAIDGFAFAAESLVGRYIGAKDSKNLKKAIHFSFYWGIGLGLLFTIIYALFSQPILEIFTNKSKLISLSLDFMIWTIVAPVISSLCYIWDGIFIGATKGTAMRNSMLISLFLIYLPIYYLTVDHLFNHGLWFALTTFMIARSITLLYYYKRSIFLKIS